MDCHKRYSCWPQDSSHWLLWSPERFPLGPSSGQKVKFAWSLDDWTIYQRFFYNRRLQSPPVIWNGIYPLSLKWTWCPRPWFLNPWSVDLIDWVVSDSSVVIDHLWWNQTDNSAQTEKRYLCCWDRQMWKINPGYTSATKELFIIRAQVHFFH